MKNRIKKADIVIIAVLLILIAAAAAALFRENSAGVSQDGGGIGQHDAEFSDYIGKKTGILKGSSFEAPTFSYFPQNEYIYYDSLNDLILALKERKIDCFIHDEPILRVVSASDSGIGYLDEPLKEELYSFAFPKDSEKSATIREEFNVLLARYSTDGTLDRLKEKWFGDKTEEKIIEDRTLTGGNGKLTAFIVPTSVPFCYISEGEPVGYSVELTYLFCREYGYDVEFELVSIAEGLEGLSSGKYDIGADALTVTKERMDTVSFSDPICSGGLTLAVRAEDISGIRAAEPQKTFLEKITESFEKDFIREDRWKLIVSGIGTTCSITALSALFGTVLAFLICLFRRTDSVLAGAISDLYVKIFQGMPVVVLLMILYYAVFGKSGMRAEWTAVIGFSLIFGAYASEIMRSGIESVSSGQREAALALGYSENMTFFKYVFPQAVLRFLPVYKGEVISLLKGTSVVGYIAVQDLTKMSDIIRSRTYEAFFPLISTAVIYFLLAGVISVLLTVILSAADRRYGKR